MAKVEHLSDAAKGLHDSVDKSTDGACLFHYYESHRENSCSYRWQGRQDPREDHTNIYANYPLASEKSKLRERGIVRDHLRTMQYDTKAGGQNPADTCYAKTLALPEQPKDWDLDGPERQRPIPAARPGKVKRFIRPNKNFTTATWPYWNNAHHLIPKALFRERIAEIEDEKLRTLVEVGLFRGRYNINHYKNVIFLPMDQEVAQVLQLPRHLTLQGPAAVKTGADYADHTEYTARVEDELQPIVDAFARSMRSKAKNLCKGVKTARLSRQRLEQLSETCFKKVTGFGKKKPGAPLNDMPRLGPRKKKPAASLKSTPKSS
jgi:hypothetical protein